MASETEIEALAETINKMDQRELRLLHSKIFQHSGKVLEDSRHLSIEERIVRIENFIDCMERPGFHSIEQLIDEKLEYFRQDYCCQ